MEASNVKAMREALRQISRVAVEMTRGTITGDAPSRKEVDRWAMQICVIIDSALTALRRESATTEKSSAVGNSAALREALEKVLEILNREWDAHRETSAMWEMQEICTAALAKPPRNCDLPEVAEWQPTGMAKQAWRVFKRSHKDSHLDAYGLLRCISWLLASATKKEGGEK